MSNTFDRAKVLESYGRGYRDLCEALEEFPEKMWGFKPTPERWSIHEIIVHLSDSEGNSWLRFRRAIAEPGSGVLAYDENRWAAALHYSERDAQRELELFRQFRETTYALLKILPEEGWNSWVMHEESGKMTLDEMLEKYESHVHVHIRQMKGNYLQWVATVGIEPFRDNFQR